jgi:orotate phosphoribosyltransferase
LVIGADPIVGGVLAIAGEQGRAIDGFLVRKEAKGYGMNKLVEGPVRKGTRVVIVEDVVTSGSSALKAVEQIEEFGCKVVMVAGLVDRLQGGSEAFAARKLPFRALLTIRDLGVEPMGD